jgi:hypothetical protein
MILGSSTESRHGNAVRNFIDITTYRAKNKPHGHCRDSTQWVALAVAACLVQA